MLTAACFGLAGLLLAGYALAVRAPWPRGAQLAHVVVSGLLMRAVQFGAFYSALGPGVPGGVVVLIQGLNPPLIAVLAIPLLGERLTGRQWLGFAVGATGVGMAIVDQLGFSTRGVALCMLGLLKLTAGTLHRSGSSRRWTCAPGPRCSSSPAPP